MMSRRGPGTVLAGLALALTGASVLPAMSADAVPSAAQCVPGGACVPGPDCRPTGVCDPAAGDPDVGAPACEIAVDRSALARDIAVELSALGCDPEKCRLVCCGPGAAAGCAAAGRPESEPAR